MAFKLQNKMEKLRELTFSRLYMSLKLIQRHNFRLSASKNPFQRNQHLAAVWFCASYPHLNIESAFYLSIKKKI